MPKNSNNIWEKFYECDCHAEAVSVSKGYEDDFLYLAFWKQSQLGNTWTWKQRFRIIWQLITKGTVWNDMVVLNKETAKELGKDLLKWADPNSI